MKAISARWRAKTFAMTSMSNYTHYNPQLDIAPKDGPYGMLALEEFYTRNPGLRFWNLTRADRLQIALQSTLGVQKSKRNVKVKKRKAIAPSGNKIAHKRRFNYDLSNSNSKQEIVKPSFTNKITKELRIFYIKTFKMCIDSTSYYNLAEKDSIKVAHNLEKMLCKFYTNP